MVTFEGEEAVDAGGVRREWLTILAKEMFNPNYMLFTLAKNAGEEIFFLDVNDGFHGDIQGVLPLVDGVDEPLGGVDFLFHKLHGFLLVAGVLAVREFFQHLKVLLADVEFWGVAAIQR